MLRRSKIFHDAVLSLNEGIYVFDDQGRLFLMNSAAEQILGWSEADLVNKHVHDVIHHRKPDGSLLPLEDCPIHTAIKAGSSYSSDSEAFVHKDGSTCFMSVRSSPIIEDGKVVACVTAFRDMSAHKRAEQEREHANRQLREELGSKKTLRGFISICSACKKIRDKASCWVDVEQYISANSEAEFSHSICPDCAKKLYPSYYSKEYFGQKTLSLDKRSLARHDMTSTIDYVVRDEETDAVYKGIMTNISAEGFGGYMWNSVRVGQEIFIKSEFPVDSRKAIIRWIQKDSDNFFRTGLEFVSEGRQNTSA